MEIVLYHRPQCSKSRAALDWLQQQGVPLRVVDYVQTPLDQAQLRTLAAQLAVASPRDMMRSGDALFTQLHLAQADDDALFAALAEHPLLLQRPIAVSGSRAVIGRPLERLQQWLAEGG